MDDKDDTTEITATEGPGGLPDILDDIGNLGLPKEIEKSAWKAIGQLITNAADVGSAWLESKTDGIRSETKAKSIVTLEAAKAAGVRFHIDTALADRAVQAFANRIVGEQVNREAVAKAAVDELKRIQPSEEPKKVVEDDWLYQFNRYAEGVSNEKMREVWGRVLARQVVEPGTFSIRALNTLSVMNQGDANTFQYVMNFTYWASFGESGVLMPHSSQGDKGKKVRRWWMETGVDEAIKDLQTLGLFYTDGLIPNLNCEAFIRDISIIISGQPFSVAHSADDDPDKRLSFLPHYRMTPLGEEFSRLIYVETNHNYIELVRDLLRDKGIVLEPLKEN